MTRFFLACTFFGLGLSLAACSSSIASLDNIEERDNYTYYLNDKLYSGTATSYYDDGQIKVRRSFKDGKDHGLWTGWHANGQKRFEGDRREGKAQGLTTWWYDNGQIKQQGVYEMDQSIGTWSQYYEDGTLKKETRYVDGKKDGLTVSYEESGRKVKEELYRSGELIETNPKPRIVAFTSERDGNWEIYRVNIDGSNLVRLTDNPASDRGPWWSEDGQRIRFRSDRTGEFVYYSMQPDGSDVQPYEPHGSRSPDGARRIVVQRVDEFPQLVMIDATKTDTLTNNETYARLSFADWAPDARSVLYLAGDSPGSQKIWSLDLDTRASQLLTQEAGTHNTAQFSPDGARILFNSNRDGAMSTYIMDVDGSGVLRLLPDRISAHASWISDDLILLDTESSKGVFDVHVIKDDGSGLTNISQSGKDGWPSVQPSFE